jgi:hypothetical protein
MRHSGGKPAANTQKGVSIMLRKAGCNWKKIVFVLWLAASFCSAHAADMKPEEVVAKHLDSIGTAQARAALKSRVVQGTSHFKVVVNGGGQLQGTAGIVSEQRKAAMVLKFADNQYRGEQMVCDGDKFSIAATTSSHHRSILGEFIWSQSLILREGLLGGELSTAWSLANLDVTKPTLSYAGLKKVDGRQVHDLRYRSKKGNDMDIHMYFDAETFQHVSTVYKITLPSGLGGFVPSASDQAGLTHGTDPGGSDPTQSVNQRETRYTLEERFSDFKTADGITLPTHYNIQFTQELQDNRTTVYEWDATFDQVSENVTLDPRNFQVK